MISVRNALTGRYEMQLVDEEHVSDSLLANSDHCDMVNDSERNRRYHRAIARTLHRQPADRRRVLDIGTGSGLLGMLAASHGATHVDACELFKPLAGLARQIIHHNQLHSLMDVHAVRSDDWTPAQKADVLVSEILDSELLGEGVLPCIRDAQKRLLNADAKIVPAAATVWAQLFECQELFDAYDANASISIPGRSEPIKLNPHSESNQCQGAPSPISVQIARLGDKYKALSEPFFAFHIDFYHPPTDQVHFNQLSIQTTATGKCHGVCFWWDLALDRDDPDNVLSMSWMEPVSTQIYTSDSAIQCDATQCSERNQSNEIPKSWRDHWMQNVRLLPSSPAVTVGDRVSLSCQHDDYSVWFNLNATESREQPMCTCGLHSISHYTRMWQRHQTDRWQLYAQSIDQLISQCSNESPVMLNISDGSVLALLAGACSSKTKVFTVENHSVTSANIAQRLVDRNKLSDQVQILRCDVDQLQSSQFPALIDRVVAEPFFLSADLPWDHLYIWFAFNTLRSRGLLSNSCSLLPAIATIRAQLVRLPHLSHSFARVNRVEGLDLTAFNAVAEQDAYICTYPLWMYDVELMSDPFDLIRIDMVGDVCDLNAGGSESIASNGVAHGVALWIDWHLSVDGPVVSGSMLPDNAPAPLRQGLYVFPAPCQGTQLKWSLHFDSEHGKFDFDFKLI